MNTAHKSNVNRASLAELHAFVAIADARSFTRAAKALDVSPSALSHTIRALETRLRVTLLARTTRSVAPTEAGQRLLATVRPAFEEIAVGLRTVGELGDAPSGTVRITTFKYAAASVLMPILPRYLAAYPNVRVEIVTEERLVDVVAEGYDAGIRFAEHVDKDMVAVKVGKAGRFAIVGSPSYFAKYPAPRTPSDLLKHRCINWRIGNGRIQPWELERSGRVRNVRVEGPLAFNEAELVLRAALEGLGIAYHYDAEVEAHVKAGRLVPVLREWTPSYPPFQLYYPSRKQVTPALAALIALLREADAPPRA